MEAKGLEFSEYMSKESLAQQGGYGLALKGPQHDEAWLIFLDMVHNFMPTFEQKAEALHWFPLFRTWFGLCGLCKLPWNDVTPPDNKQTPEPAKVMQHVEWYAEYFGAVTGRKVEPDDLIAMSERVYNFQRIFCLRLGYGRREHDAIPYRAMGPVTVEEYESRAERYDKQLKETHSVNIEGKTTAEKVKILRKTPGRAVRAAEGRCLSAQGLDERRDTDPRNREAPRNRLSRSPGRSAAPTEWRDGKVDGRHIDWHEGMTVADLLERTGGRVPLPGGPSRGSSSPTPTFITPPFRIIRRYTCCI